MCVWSVSDGRPPVADGPSRKINAGIDSTAE